MKKILITIMAISLIALYSVPAFADANANAGAAAWTDDHSTNTSKVDAPDRAFPIPGRVGYGPVINYYGKPLPGSQFRPVESLLMYANIFSEGALEEILTNGTNADIIVDLNVVREPSVQVRASYEKGEARWIKIVANQTHLKDHGLIGYVTSEADDRKTDMLEVIAAAALEAIREGSDVLQIVAQGAARDTETSGWGIGFNTTQATMLNGGSTGSGGANVSSGGTGYSQAWAGMRDKPWIQANALKSPAKIIGFNDSKPPMKEKVAETDDQTGNHKTAKKAE